MSSFPQTHRPSYGQIQSLLELYLRLLKANPIITKSITSGIIACAGSSLSQVGIAEFSFYLIWNEILTSNFVFISILFCWINIWFKTKFILNNEKKLRSNFNFMVNVDTFWDMALIHIFLTFHSHSDSRLCLVVRCQWKCRDHFLSLGALSQVIYRTHVSLSVT